MVRRILRSKKKWLPLLALVPLATVLAEPARSQDAGAALTGAAGAMGAEGLSSFRFSGSGSSYAYEGDMRIYSRVSGYMHEIDLEARSSRVSITRLTGSERTGEAEDRMHDAAAPWEEQAGLWLVPHVFVQEALTKASEASQERELGIDYTVVTYRTADGHEVQGYISEDYLVEKVRTEVEDPELGTVALEARYLQYDDFDGIRFPRIIIQKTNGMPTLVVVVKEVRRQTSG